MCGNLLYCVAKHIRMVESDLSDACHKRIDNVCCVDESSNSYLKYDELTATISEVEQRHHKGDLEKSHHNVELPDRFSDIQEVGDNVFLGDHLHVDADALPEAAEVR